MTVYKGEIESDSRRGELFSLIKARSFKTGEFTLASGKKSNLYFNMKPTMMSAKGAALSAQAFLAVMEETDSSYVSGLEMGAVPIIGSMAAISALTGNEIAATFVRKAPKKHGTKDIIEGLGPDESLDGQRVLVVDDVATTGISILQATLAVREANGIVEHAACIVDRQEGATELLAENGVRLHSIFTRLSS